MLTMMLMLLSLLLQEAQSGQGASDGAVEVVRGGVVRALPLKPLFWGGRMNGLPVLLLLCRWLRQLCCVGGCGSCAVLCCLLSDVCCLLSGS